MSSYVAKCGKFFVKKNCGKKVVLKQGKADARSKADINSRTGAEQLGPGPFDELSRDSFGNQNISVKSMSVTSSLTSSEKPEREKKP